MRIGDFLREKRLSPGDNARLLISQLGFGDNLLKAVEAQIGESAKMSKSKGNTVDPQEAIERYGADTIRLYILFAGPPQQDFEWTDEGIQGAHRFLHRLWNFVHSVSRTIQGTALSPEVLGSAEGKAKEVRREVHSALADYLRDMEKRFQFNTAIARIMKLLNILSDFKPGDEVEREVLKEGVRILLLMLAPFTPHICEELWQVIGEKGLIVNQRVPEVDTSALEIEQVEVPVQINGKVRSRVIVPVDAREEKVREIVLADERVRKYLNGKGVKRLIYIKNKLINIVTEE